MADNLLTEISFSKTDLGALVDDLEEKVDLAKGYQARWRQDYATWMRSYLTISSGRRMDPWPDSSDVYLPMNRVGVDGLLAQFHDAMFTNDPFVKVRASTGSAVDASRDLTQYYGEYFYSRQVPFRAIGQDFLFDAVVGGTGVIKDRIDRSEFLRRRLVTEEQPVRGGGGLAQRAFGFFMGDIIQLPAEETERR